MYLYPPLCVYMVVLYYMSACIYTLLCVCIYGVLYYMSVCNVFIPSSVCVYMVVLYYMSVCNVFIPSSVCIYGGARAVLYECM